MHVTHKGMNWKHDVQTNHFLQTVRIY